MRSFPSKNSVLPLLLLTILTLGPAILAPLTMRASPGPTVYYADSLTMPLPATPLPSPGSTPLSPISGIVKVLVIAVEFSDVNHTKSIDQIKQAYFGTLAAYYAAVSYGTVSVQGDVVGWYRLPHPMAYYGRDCTSVDDSDCSGQLTSWWLARDAVNVMNRDPNVNVNNYDYFVFLHSGIGEESSHNKDTVWSVAYLAGVWLQTKGKSISSFDLVPELEDQGAIPNGVYTHEFGHLLGLPDLYNIFNGQTVLGQWALMDKGLWNGNPPGSSPAWMEAWSRMKLGWLNGTRLTVAQDGALASYTVDAAELQTTTLHAVEIPITTTTYYLVEVRERIGFDQALPSTGVLILYVASGGTTRTNQGSTKVTIMNAHPSVPGLQNATWSVGQVFTDTKNDIAVAVNGEVGNSFQITVNRLGPLPDLAVSKIYTQPTTLTPNTTVTILVDINNQGSAAATNVPVQVFIDNQPFANKIVSLQPGGATEISLAWNALAGSHILKVIIDPYNSLNELSRANNVATYTLNVGAESLPDFAVSKIYTQPTNVDPNTTVTILVDIVNQGTAAGTNVSVQVFLDNQTLANQILTLQAGGSTEISLTWNATTGGHLVKVVIDPDNALTELNKANNVATYTLNVGPTAIITVPLDVGASNASAWVQINGVKYMPNNSSQVVATVAVGPVTVEVEPALYTSNETRQAFANWSDGNQQNPRQVNITANTQLGAKYQAQYLLSINRNGGTTSPGGWNNANSAVTVAASSPSNVTEQASRLMFNGWSGDISASSTSITLNMTKPETLTANWKQQYYVSIISPVGSVSGSGWYDAGTPATISLRSALVQQNNVRQVFAGWSGGTDNQTTTKTIVVNAPTILQANWKTQYLVQVQSSYGNPTGSGWYDAGSQVPISVSSMVDFGNNTRIVFDGWEGDYTGTDATTTLTADSPKTLDAQWTTQYRVTLRVGGVSNATMAKLLINDTYHDISMSNSYQAWVNRGVEINPSINETLGDGFMQVKFNGWNNATGGLVTPPFTVNGPVDYTASYQQAFPSLAIPGFPIESVLAGILIGFMALALLRRRKRSN